MTAAEHPCRPKLLQRRAGQGELLEWSAPFPCNPIGEGTTLKPDISLATKSGHFNLPPTVLIKFVKFILNLIMDRIIQNSDFLLNRRLLMATLQARSFTGKVALV